ncbi:MAG: FAD-dependent monooxygenase, partial [Blastocatellia bacterium]|nr:FAD-dependent monooxygenase [Blastocatellia bacterium]
MNQKVIIIGAGLAGSLLAIYVAKRGIAVEIYEARGDMRLETVAAGRSINLALSDRGIAALREVGMDEYMLSEAVPMYGRMIHSVSGETKLLPYSGRQGEYINSVSRAGLNIALINEAEKHDGVRFYFNERCVDFDCRTGEAHLSSGKIVKGNTLIATDGAGSAVRHAMLHGGVERFNFEQTWLEHGYKELVIPSGQNRLRERVASEFPSDQNRLRERVASEFVMEKNALHIWPRHKFMMIALPNFDGSFTCTLFLALKGENSFERLERRHPAGKTSAASRNPPAHAGGSDKSRNPPAHAGGSDKSRNPSAHAGGYDLSAETLIDFFEANFPDALQHMPTLTEDFFANPVGNLGTIKCFPWNVGGKALLLGDSAHAVVPFYGQGMNCAFEDVRVLDQVIEKHGTDWETVYNEYGELRKINTDAIADMAEENFYEMRDAVADPVFVRKRELETKLEQTYPDYFSKYSMV